MGYSSVVMAFVAMACLTGSVLGENGNQLAGDVDQRIFNGQDAKPGQFPYQTLLFMHGENGKNSFCGGSLIAPNVVLTAAHCCVQLTETEVYLGLTDYAQASDSYVQKRTVPKAKMFPHEKYDPNTISNDICLLHLDQPVTMNENVSTVALPPQQDSNPSRYNWQTVQISGFGQTNDIEGLHNKLQFSSVTVKPHSLCALWYTFINRVTTTQLCTGKFPQYSGPCHGDSGGPMTVKLSDGKPMEIGLVSWGVGSCGGINPVVYTYVAAFHDWIQANMPK